MEKFRNYLVNKIASANTDLDSTKVSDLNGIAYAYREEDTVVSFNINDDADTVLPIAMAAKTREALGILAKLLQTDPACADTETVVMTSWIVTDHPRMIERLGFRVV